MQARYVFTMTVSFSYLRFILILALNVVQLQGRLTPNGNVSVECGSTQTFTCNAPDEPIKWTTSGLSGISRGPFLARHEAYRNARVMSTDTGDTVQRHVSGITISEFSTSDDGGSIQCVNANDTKVQGMASISVGLRAPANVVAKTETCSAVTLQWNQPRVPDDIIISVNCTPPSPGCAECTTSPCNITGLNPSTKYEFTVSLNSTMCGTSMNTTRIGTRDLRAPTNVVTTMRSCDTVILQWDQPSEPNDITTSVSCTPLSPGCAECTTSPCNITGLNPSTEYVFTVTLNSGGCRASMSTTTARTKDLNTPTNLRAAMKSCDNITLQWDQPSEPKNITSVSCTPPSPGCAGCTTSPCNITGLNPSTEYEFTVTLNSVGCRTSMNTTIVRTTGLGAPTSVVAEMVSCDTVGLVWTQPDEPNDIIPSVSCTPPSPGCAECTTSPCNITGLNPTTEYTFTVTLNSSVCGTSRNKTEAFQIDASSCVTPNSTSNAPLAMAALVLLLLLVPLLYPLGVLIVYLLFFKDKTYCEVFWCCFCWRKDKSSPDKSYECNSTELREHGEKDAYHNVAKKEVITNGDEIKEPKKSQQEVVTYETIKKQEAKDGDAITDETVQQQGTQDGHHKQKRSQQHKEEVQYQNLDVAKKQEAISNGDEMKKPKSSKQEVINTGNVKQQQGNPDGIQYADLDFSEHQPGRNVMIPLVDPVTYADV